MATREDFTPEEWQTLKVGLIGAGISVSVSDGGMISAFKEAAAVSKTLQAEAVKGGLVGQVADMTKDRPSGADLGGRNVGTTVLAALGGARDILSAKAPDDLAVYQQAVREVAVAAAEASKGVRPAEAATVDAITAAVGLGPASSPTEGGATDNAKPEPWAGPGESAAF